MANESEMVEQTTSPLFDERSAISPSIKRSIDSQGIKPVEDISVFAGLIPDSEIDDFVAEIYETRKKP